MAGRLSSFSIWRKPIRFVLYVNVPEVLFAFDSSRASARIMELAQYPGEKFQGKVVRTAEAIDLATRTLLTEVDVPNKIGLLLPGGYAQVHLQIQVTERASAGSRQRAAVPFRRTAGRGDRSAITRTAASRWPLAVTTGQHVGSADGAEIRRLDRAESSRFHRKRRRSTVKEVATRSRRRRLQTGDLRPTILQKSDKRPAVPEEKSLMLFVPFGRPACRMPRLCGADCSAAWAAQAARLGRTTSARPRLYRRTGKLRNLAASTPEGCDSKDVMVDAFFTTTN